MSYETQTSTFHAPFHQTCPNLVLLISSSLYSCWIHKATQSLHVEPEKNMCLLLLMTNSIQGEDKAISIIDTFMLYHLIKIRSVGNKQSFHSAYKNFILNFHPHKNLNLYKCNIDILTIPIREVIRLNPHKNLNLYTCTMEVLKTPIPEVIRFNPHKNLNLYTCTI